jgi:hypothetical protein
MGSLNLVKLKSSEKTLKISIYKKRHIILLEVVLL